MESAEGSRRRKNLLSTADRRIAIRHLLELTVSDPSKLRVRMGIRAFVLTIDDIAGPRRGNAARQLGGVGVPFEFVEGYRAANPGALAGYSRALNLILHKRSLSNAEVAIYEGHRRIWREIVARGLDMALVAEDDILIHDPAAFMRAVDDLRAAPDAWDIAKFFDFRPKKAVRKIIVGETTLLAYKYPASGAVAYLISARAAAALLKRRRIFRPVDEDFSHPWEFSIHVWSVSPNPAGETSATLGGSIIETDRQSVRMRRNLARSIWGNVLQFWKLARSGAYRRSYSAKARSATPTAS